MTERTVIAVKDSETGGVICLVEPPSGMADDNKIINDLYQKWAEEGGQDEFLIDLMDAGYQAVSVESVYV